ncbi:MAG TPA: hypothetical protein VIG49_05445, partial [Acetobacteraceae bacterium]
MRIDGLAFLGWHPRQGQQGVGALDQVATGAVEGQRLGDMGGVTGGAGGAQTGEALRRAGAGAGAAVHAAAAVSHGGASARAA